MPKIIHDKKQCIGCGTCAAMCPAYFEIDEKDNVADLKNSKLNGQGMEELDVEDPKSIEGLEDAIAFCPVRVIKIVEE